jgi:hypothetical protein
MITKLLPKKALGKHLGSIVRLWEDRQLRGKPEMTAKDGNDEEPVDDSRSESVKPSTTEATSPSVSNAAPTPRRVSNAPRPTTPLPPGHGTASGLGWEQTTNWDPQHAMRRNAALLDGGGSQVLPTPAQQAADLLAQKWGTDLRPTPRFRENLEHTETKSRWLASVVRGQIDLLKSERRNDPERQAEIDFLEFVASGLERIADAIREARRAANAEEKEQKLSEVPTIADGIAGACRDFAQRNYEKITDYGGYSAFITLGTLFFVNLFGVSPEFAMETQLALLGLAHLKK